jgi:hypothetical protein
VNRLRLAFVAAAAGLLVAAASSSGGAGPLPLRTAAAPSGPRLGITTGRGGTTLGWFDPVTLTPAGNQITLPFFLDAWRVSPDGSTLAVAHHPTSGSERGTLEFVDLRSMQLLRPAVPIGDWARAIGWTSPDRIDAVLGSCCSTQAWVVRVDPVARRVVARHLLGGSPFEVVHWRGSLVALRTPPTGIGRVALVVVGADGVARTVELKLIAAGYRRLGPAVDPIQRVRGAGVAVDQDTGRAFVVAADGLVAEVDLTTLAVSYHRPARPVSLLGRLAAWLQPDAAAKGMSGPVRDAIWLGDGLLAVTGTDYSARLSKQGKILEFTGRPAGVRIVDTRRWTVRTLDPGGTAAVVADGALLVTGGSFTSKPTGTTGSGMGLAAYGADGTRRFQLFAGRRAYVAVVSGGRAYVGVGGGTLSVVDLASGRVVGSAPVDIPYLIDAG